MARRCWAYSFFAGLLVFDVLNYFVLPRPEVVAQPIWYEEPFKTLFSIAMFVLSVYVLVIGVYWLFTRSPRLVLDEDGIIYRPTPFVTRRLRWADLEHVSASRDSFLAVPVPYRVVSLTIWADVKAHAHLSYNGKSKVSVRIGQAGIGMQVDDLARLIARYKKVTYWEKGGKRRVL